MIHNVIRKLARNNKYQSLYARAKDLGNLQLFSNVKDLTSIQFMFLDWLEIYNSLYSDIAMNEKNIDFDVIEDDIRTEAYLLWRREQRKKKDTKEDRTKKARHTDGSLPSVIFTNKKEVNNNGR